MFRAILRLMGATLVITIILAWIFYPEQYNFFYEPISRLGGYLTTDEKLDNTTSRYIFSVGLVVCGVLSLIMFLMSLRPKNFSKDSRGRKYVLCIEIGCVRLSGPIWFKILTLGMMAGAIMIAFPRDAPSAIGKFFHVAGVIFFLGGFFLFNLIAQTHKKNPEKKRSEEKRCTEKKYT